MNTDLVATSRFLSLVLRHRPETVGLALDAAGWVEVDALLAALARHGRPLSRVQLEAVVANNDKRRFAFSEDGQRIRASQGHSLRTVDLELAPAVPPETLYHGTVARFLEAIRREGLVAGQRQHVHLSGDVATAERVGARRGRPVVLTVAAGAMDRQGHPFWRSDNGVWLTGGVPSAYMSFPAS